MGRRAMVLLVPALMAGASACGSSSSETPVTPGGGETDASADAVSDAKPDSAKPDAADADSGPSGCIPDTCTTLGANCGTAPDGCGGKITCGDCPSGQTCGGGGQNVCGTGSCEPKTCAQVGASCGYASDGCSDILSCGDCPPPSVCGGAGVANQCGCTPKTCTQLGASCGTLPDGCFGKVDCGNCLSGQTCGGGGPNQCGTATCKPKTCSQLSASCGYVSDGCSDALDCGSCTDPNVCGGGGIANQCGCTAKTCSQLGASCGTVDNGCQSVSCGDCTTPDTCGGAGVDNQCGCTCTLPHAQTNCQHGACSIKQCEQGWGDCDGNATNGCETDLRTTVTDCGTCGHGCSFAHAGATCQLSQCAIGTCDQDYDNCNNDPSDGCESHLTADPTNCNTCGTACPALGGTPICTAGVCGTSTCDTGKGDCDNNTSNGCETDITTSVDHCGACGNPCTYANATAQCVSSVCQLDTCNAGYGDCDGNESNGCETNTSISVANCGSCNNQCPTPAHSSPTCANGQCGYACDPGWADCDGQAGNGCEVHTDADVGNCGVCGKVCSIANGTASCTAGQCTVASCNGGFADCNGLPGDGCEVNTTKDTKNCGGCGAACSTNHGTASCTSSKCGISCDSGYANCDVNVADGCEVHTTSDTANCGGCGVACSANNMAVVACDLGICDGVCATNFADCNGNKQIDGCESDLWNSPSTCGGCGNVCSNNNIANPVCSNGNCTGTCNNGFADCNTDKLTDGCEINLKTDINNCNGCNLACSNNNMTSVTCVGGVCGGTCSTGFADCNHQPADGCESNLKTDPLHCGTCSTPCSNANIPTPTCSGGTCNGTCSPGYADCDGNKTVNGCEVNLTNDPANCGACAFSCTGKPNVNTVQCSSGSCSILTCGSGYSNQDNQWSNGCECAADSVGDVCGAALNLGTVSLDSTAYFPSPTGSYTITPTGTGINDEDWFAVTFANTPACNYNPKIALNDLSGTGLLRMQVYTSACGTATPLTCNGSGETGNATTTASVTWEFTYSAVCGANQAIDPTKGATAFFGNGMTNVFRVRVFTTGSSTTCLPYRLTISN